MCPQAHCLLSTHTITVNTAVNCTHQSFRLLNRASSGDKKQQSTVISYLMVLPLLGHAWMPCTTEQIPQHLLSATSVATTMNPLNMYALTCRLVTSTCNPVSSTYRHVAIYMTTKTMIYHTYEYAYFLSLPIFAKGVHITYHNSVTRTWMNNVHSVTLSGENKCLQQLAQ